MCRTTVYDTCWTALYNTCWTNLYDTCLTEYLVISSDMTLCLTKSSDTQTTFSDTVCHGKTHVGRLCMTHVA